MDMISYTELKGNLKGCLDKVCNRHSALFVKRKEGGSVVIMSQEDFDSLEETAYLLKSSKNAKRLMGSLARKGRKKYRSLKELEDEAGI